MNSPVVTALFPVVLFVILGFFTGRIGWIRSTAIKDMSNLVFMLLSPAVLFRSMSQIKLAELDFFPVLIYFSAATIIFLVALWLCDWSKLGAARGLASTFSNAVMMGVSLVGLAFGDEGLVTLLPLIAVHSLVLLGSATLLFELAVEREKARSGEHPPKGLARTVLGAMKNSILHPVPLPIIAGLLYGLTGWGLHPLVDKSLVIMGGAMVPVALLLVGVTLSYSKIGQHWRMALKIALVKNIVHPSVMALAGWLAGLEGLAFAVMITTAAMPAGSNVFLFAQRYGVAQDEVTSVITISTAMGLCTLPVVLALVSRLL